MNTTLEKEVQTISKQLFAIFVVKLDGKALGIVQLVGKGEGLEAWRQLKLQHEGKSGNRQAALLREIVNPRVESLNRWEKTISLYRTASGVEISDRILAATVLEHSPENYQNILKQAPSNVRALCVAGCVSTQRRCGDRTGLPQQTQSTGPVPMEVDQTRAVSGFHSARGSHGKGQGTREGQGQGWQRQR